MQSKWVSALLGILSILYLALPLRSFGAFEQGVSGSGVSDLDMGTALSSQYESDGNLLDPSFSSSALSTALLDEDQRVGVEFKVPRSLKNAVAFWLKVYTLYTTEHLVLFDSQNPEIIYDVLDFRELSLHSRNRMAFEITRNNRVTAAHEAYRRAFAHLAHNRAPKHPTPEERKILVATRHLSKPDFSKLAKNLKSQTGQRDNIVKGLVSAEPFFPKMEEIFQHLGVPGELTRLTLVESSFDLGVTSKVGAAGVWQFMPASGREYLLIDEKREVDERLSPLKATVAAGRLLLRNRRILGNWLLSVISYNHGLKDLPRHKSTSGSGPGSNSYSPALAAKLGWASRNYYSEFLAVLYAEKYRDLFYGEPPAPALRPVAFTRLEKQKSAISLCMESGTSLQEFLSLNPDVGNARRLLPTGYWVALPSDRDDWSILTLNRGLSSSQRLARTRRARTRPDAG